MAVFVGHPYTALTITTLVAIYFFGIRRGLTRDKASKMATDSLLPVGTLICIMGGGGALKQIIVDSGVGDYAGKLLMTSSISPLLVVWLIAAVHAHGAGLGHRGHHYRRRYRRAAREGHSRATRPPS